MTDHEALQQIYSIAGAQLAVAPQPPDPVPPEPTPIPPIPPAGISGELVLGQGLHLPPGASSWTHSNASVDFGVHVAGMNDSCRLTIRRPDGTIAQRQKVGAFPMGDADLTFPNGGGSLYVWVDQPGTYVATVDIGNASGDSRIELLTGIPT
jgi:hypothetical protein